jgi:NAD(P)-dependent dehydrogenase (short-subunit alcohol dehydrogenase family)
MHVLARLYVRGGVANDLAIAPHRAAARDALTRDFVTRADVFVHWYTRTECVQLGAGREVFLRDHDVVRGMKKDDLLALPLHKRTCKWSYHFARRSQVVGPLLTSLCAGDRRAKVSLSHGDRDVVDSAAFNLTGRVAVVVGGTSGIGRSLALGLAQAGADVIATGRRAEEAAAVASEIEQLGRKSLRVTSDVCARASLDALLERVLSAFEKVDILVNCAGKTKRTPTLEVSDEEWADILETNLTGTLRTCQVFGRHMLQRGYGRIVNIASLSSFVALYEVAAYSASKAAVASLTKSLAVEWGARGVNVNAIAPGVFRTALNQALLDGTDRGREFLLRTPLKRFGKVEELNAACIFLASEASSFVNGEVLAVDGGFLASGVNQ